MPESQLRALLVDWGGVLTNSLRETMIEWCDEEGIDHVDFLRVMRDMLGDDAAREAVVNPVHALERGEIEVPHFEEQFAAKLRRKDGGSVPSDGLLTRMFAGFRSHPGMIDVVRRAREHGLKTGLLSNSWGLDYPRDDWEHLFDVVVISGEVGMRKPDPDIYRYAAEQLSLSPAECVFVDDLPPNVRGAAAVGMVGVLHDHVDTTITELETLFGLSFRG